MQQNTVTPVQPEPSPEEPAEPAPAQPDTSTQTSSLASSKERLRQQIWPDDRCFVLSLN